MLLQCKLHFDLAFQSTLPRGERQQGFVGVGRKQTISIHAPARGATIFGGCNNGNCNNFNPRSREGSDVTDRHKVQELTEISIHAPARGATERPVPLKVFGPKISIHAPARGATSILSKIHPMFLTISHNASSFSSFPFHSFLPHLLNSSTFCALFQVRISRAFSVYYRFAPKKSTPDL